jgi:Holliday junction resolvasome RuvABC DNA-binding subunit
LQCKQLATEGQLIHRHRKIKPTAAERIVLELKEKIAKTFGETGLSESASSPSQIRSENFSALEDAQAALMALGYKFREIQMVIDKNRAHIKDDMSTEDIVRVLLQNVH